MKRPLRLVSFASLGVALVLATGAGAAPAPILNPGFESFVGGPTVPANWTAPGGSSFTRDTALARTGTASLHFPSQSANSAQSDCFAVSGSTMYYLSFWYHTESAGVSLTGDVKWFTNGSCGPTPGDLVGTIPAIQDGPATTTFHQFNTSGNSPAGALSAFVQIVGNGAGGFGSFTLNADDVVLDTSPTAVNAWALAARRSNGAVTVTWRAGATANTLGFNVWRAARPTGAYTKLNQTLLVERGSTYRYLDQTARPGRSYFYKLQVVRPDGSARWAGTVAVTSRA